MRLLCAAGATLLAGAAAATDPGPAAFRRFRLENGLTLLVQEDRRAPLVSVGMMYAAGARNEAAGQTGIAHYVEHMNFRSLARFPGGASTEEVTRRGGRWSGYTWIDQTYYAATVPRDALGVALDVELDRMTEAVFDRGDFERERSSVIAELRSYDDPRSVLYDAVLAASFELHPYRHNTIGWLTDVEQVTRDEAHAFYRRFYHPNNAVLAVVGDVDAESVAAEVRRRFAPLPAAGAAATVRTVEPPQLGQRRVTVRRPGPHAHVLAAWRAPALQDADFAAMVLFDALLAGGKGFEFTADYPVPPGAPLQRALVGAGRATRARTDWQASRHPYVYTADAAVAAEAGLPAAEAALLRAIEDAAARDWSAGELAAARRQVRAGWAADLDDLPGRAHQLAFFETAGSAELLAVVLERLEATGAEDARRFARARLRPDQATVGWFVPADAAAAAVPPGPSPTPSASPSAPPPPSVAPGPVAAAAPFGATARHEPSGATSFVLDNGVRVRVVPGGRAGLGAVRARIDLGPARVPRAAAVALVAERLARPAPDEPRTGSSLSLTLHDEPAAWTNGRWIELSADALADDLPSVLALLAARLAAAAAPIPDAEWTALTAAAAERAREHALTPETALLAHAARLLYPRESPLAQPPWGTEEAVRAATAAQVRDAARAWLQPRRVDLALAGALPPGAVRPALDATLGRWTVAGPPAAGGERSHEPPRTRAQWTESRQVWAHEPQNDVLVVWPGDRRSPADEAATRAITYLLGETGYAGRLGRALVEPGLVYSVYTTLEEAPGAPGFLAVRTAAAPSDTREVLRRIREEVETAARGAFTQPELDEAKAYLRGRDLLRRDGSAAAAQAELEDATQPRRFDPQRLTLDQLNATARRLFARGAPLAIVLGPGGESGGERARASGGLRCPARAASYAGRRRPDAEYTVGGAHEARHATRAGLYHR